MHTEFVHYFTTLRAFQTVRWAMAAVAAQTGLTLVALSSRMLPEGHPAKALIASRVETSRTTILPSMSVGCPRWAVRLGQGITVAALATVILLVSVGGSRTTHHIQHGKQERPADLWRK